MVFLKGRLLEVTLKMSLLMSLLMKRYIEREGAKQNTIWKIKKQPYRKD